MYQKFDEIRKKTITEYGSKITSSGWDGTNFIIYKVDEPGESIFLEWCPDKKEVRKIITKASVPKEVTEGKRFKLEEMEEIIREWFEN